MWGKKVSLFSKLNFCFAKSDLPVWEDFWDKMVEKGNDIVGKTLKLVCVQNNDINSTKRKSEIGIFFVIQHVAVFWRSRYNRIWTWCAKFVKMMDVCAVWKCSLLVQKRSKCLNSFAKLIYFSETFSILCFAEMLCSDCGLMKSFGHNIMAPQNFDPKFHIHEKVLNFCWLN